MRRRALLLTILLGVALVPATGSAQRARPYRIGAVTENWGPSPQVVGLRDGLGALGYRENQDFVLGVRFTSGDFGALPGAVRDFIQQGVDVLVAGSGSGLTVARDATSSTPILFISGGDPVAQGVIRSYAKPGGNVTGVTSEELELTPKRLEIFQAAVPGMKRILYVHDATNPYSPREADAYRAAARRLGITLTVKPARTREEVVAVFAQLRKGDTQGFVSPFAVTLNIPGVMIETANRLSLPTMFGDRVYVELGGFASYGPDLYASGRQAARLREKIMRGANPGDIPVEVNNRVELALNAKVARALKITVPPDVAVLVNRLIE